MPRAPVVVALLPFLVALIGLVLCAWRFRAGDSFLGLVFGLGGMLGMLVLAIRLGGSGGEGPPPAPPRAR